MGLRRKNTLEHINDIDKLIGSIDTGLRYINVCKLQLSINKMRFEMGYISKQELKDETQKILRKVMLEVMGIKDYVSAESFKNRIKELSQGTRHENQNSEEISTEFIEKKLGELFIGIKDIMD